MARITGDSTRDLQGPTLDSIRRSHPDLDLEAGDTSDLRQMGKIFGEDLPAGLVFSAKGPASDPASSPATHDARENSE